MRAIDLSTERNDREQMIQRAVATLELLSRHMSEVHAPEFLEIPVTMPQAKVLYLVVTGGRLHMSELAARLGVTLSTVSGLVDRLVDSGLVERSEDPADRRQIIVAPTGLGLELLERFQEVNAAHLRALLDRVATADLAIVERAFAILSDAATSVGVESSSSPAAIRNTRSAS